MTTNKAAERLRNALPDRHKWLADAALAVERRATVERILRGLRSEDDTDQMRAVIAQVEAMRDEEAAR